MEKLEGLAESNQEFVWEGEQNEYASKFVQSLIGVESYGRFEKSKLLNNPYILQTFQQNLRENSNR